MKSLFTALILLLLCSNISYSQNSNKSHQDTSQVNLKQFIDSEFYSPREFFYPDLNLYQNSFNGSIWTRTMASINYGNGDAFISRDVTKNMLVPLRLKYLDSQKFSLIREILGAAQMTAVGIMAYQHIKRYGFIKKSRDGGK